MGKEVEKYVPVGAVATVMTQDGKVDLRATVGSMVEVHIGNHPSTYVEDSDEAMLGMIAQILDAPTIEDVMNPQSAEGVRDNLDRPFRVERFAFSSSEYEEGSPWFMIIFGKFLDSGDDVVFTTGGIRIMAQLMRAMELGALPVEVIARKAKRATRRGFFPLHLELAK